jgi:glycosyltransferase involved in cell wall biosynthesis
VTAGESAWRAPGENAVRVSVVIPVHNGAAHLAEALNSVTTQTVQPLEIIVVDDGSTDDSIRIAGSFGQRVRCLEQPNRGAASARNLGMQYSAGECIAFLDSDDIWEGDKLERQLHALHESNGAALVFGGIEHFHSPELSPEERAALYCPAGISPGLLPSTILFRRTILNRVGEFDTRYRVGEFIDWYQRILDAGLTACGVAERVAWRRIHRGNLGLRDKSASVDFVKIVKARLDRQRGKSGASE